MFAWVNKLLGLSKPANATPGRDPLRARYDAAQTTDENSRLWLMTDLLSAKAANSFQVRKILRTRSRYEIANNSYARGITLTLANYLIGTGPRLQVRTPDSGRNKQVEAAFSQWTSAIRLPEKLRTMTLAKVGDGEAFGLFVTNPRIDASVQLDVKLIEADQVSTPDPGFQAANWVDGIVLDELGEPAAYHVLKTHPGDLFVPNLNPLAFDTIRQRNVLHWFRKDRPGQVRGIPEITPALELFAQLRRYTKAVLASAEIAANFSALLESEAPPDAELSEPVPFESLEIERGMMTTLPWGAKLKQLAAEQPTTTYEMFVRLLLREIARCLNVPFNIAAGDSSGYNYSSGRLDHLGFHRQQRVERAHCETAVLDYLLAAWLDEAVMIPGLLPAGINISAIPHRWFWDGVESIDPVKDATATQIELASNTTTLADEYAQRGEDWEVALQQRAKETALMRELGLMPEQAAPAPADQPAEPDEETVKEAA